MKMELHRQEVSESNRESEWDALRSLAVLYIVGFWHLCGYSESLCFLTSSRLSWLIRCCVLGLFTFMSGLLLSKRYKLNSIQDTMRFYKRRFIRIYPLFLGALTGYLFFGQIDLGTYVSSVFLVNMLLPVPLQTLWFVTMILLFYAMTPLFLHRYSHIKTIALTSFFVVSLVSTHLATQLIDLSLPLYIIPFAVGILMGRAAALSEILHSKYAVGIGIAMFLSTHYLFRYDHLIPKMILVDMAILAAIPPFLAMGRFLVRFVPTDIFLFLSVSSFSAYLIHRFTFRLGLRIYHPDGVLSSIVYLGLVILPLTFIIAYIVQDAYDGLLQRRLFNRLRTCLTGCDIIES